MYLALGGAEARNGPTTTHVRGWPLTPISHDYLCSFPPLRFSSVACETRSNFIYDDRGSPSLHGLSVPPPPSRNGDADQHCDRRRIKPVGYMKRLRQSL